MTALSNYIDRINTWCGYGKNPKPPMDITALTDGDAQEVFDSLDCDLSPENLHCDGEITNAQAKTKYRKFMSAGNALLKMGFTPANKYSSFL